MVLSNRASKLIDEIYKRNNEQYDYVSLIPSGELPSRKFIYQKSMLEISKPITLKEKRKRVISVSVVKDDISDMPELEDTDSDDEEDDSKKEMTVVEDNEVPTFFDDDDDEEEVEDEQENTGEEEPVEQENTGEEVLVVEEETDGEDEFDDEGEVDDDNSKGDTVEDINNKILFGLLENIRKEEKDKKEESKSEDPKPEESKSEEVSKPEKEPRSDDSIEGGGIKRIKLDQHYDFF